ncbi:MAG: hypothetical protein ACE5I4_06215 [Thermoplasmata archaeon]
MNEAVKVPVTAEASTKVEKAGSPVSRLLTLLSILSALGRRPGHGVAAPLPPRRQSAANRRYPAAGGHDMGRLLR